MERGLLWLPLLGLFIWLAWAGWNEYQKVEAYRRWAENFERHKYDIYAVLGQKGDILTWGKPTRTEPSQQQTISLSEVKTILLKLDGKVREDLDAELPNSARAIAIVLITKTHAEHSIPFTDIAIAGNWYRFLSTRLSG